MLICIEGIDGSGKSTHCRLLVEEARRRGRTASMLAFPCADTVTGPLIRRLLSGEVRVIDPVIGGPSAQALLLQCAMTINRYELRDRLQEASLDPSRLLVLDRYDLSPLAYGMADGLPGEFIQCVHNGLPPAKTLVLDVPVEASFARRPLRTDRYESDRAFLERVRANYLRLASDYGFVVIDANRSKADVHRDIVAQVFLE